MEFILLQLNFYFGLVCVKFDLTITLPSIQGINSKQKFLFWSRETTARNLREIEEKHLDIDIDDNTREHNPNLNIPHSRLFGNLHVTNCNSTENLWIILRGSFTG